MRTKPQPILHVLPPQQPDQGTHPHPRQRAHRANEHQFPVLLTQFESGPVPAQPPVLRSLRLRRRLLRHTLMREHLLCRLRPVVECFRVQPHLGVALDRARLVLRDEDVGGRDGGGGGSKGGELGSVGRLGREGEELVNLGLGVGEEVLEREERGLCRLMRLGRVVAQPGWSKGGLSVPGAEDVAGA